MKDEKKPRKRGRPKSDNPMVRMPEMLVKPRQLKTYRTAAESQGKTFSAWVRMVLDEAAKDV